MRHSHARRVSALAAALLIAGCSALLHRPPDDLVIGTPIPASADPFATPFLAADQDTSVRVGAHIRVEDATAAVPAAPRDPAVSPLAQREAAALLTRLLGAGPEAGDPPAFRFAAASLPAPRPGTTTRLEFDGAGASAAAPSPAAAGPARPIFMSPRGEVGVASQVTLAFSVPMVPLSSIAAPPAGVRLTPAPAGSWRWLDPFTLVFDAVGGLPGATRFTVEVPARTFAPGAPRLDAPVRWAFSTAPVGVSAVTPIDIDDAARPLIAVVFDQRVEPDSVLRYLRLDVDGAGVPVRLATDAELSERRVALQLRREPEGVVVVRPERAFARGDTASNWRAVLRVLPGAWSAEGPIRTKTEAAHEFTVAKGLRVVEHGCGRAPECVPGVPWTIRFSGYIRSEAEVGGLVTVEPSLPGATVEAWGQHLVVLGAAEPGRTYTVRLDPSIRTWTGGALGETEPLRFEIGDARPNVWLPGDGLALIGADGPAAYPVLAEGVDSVRIELRVVTVDRWSSFRASRRNNWPDSLPGRVIARMTVPVERAHGGPGEAVVDLEAALEESGHVVLIAEPEIDGRQRRGAARRSTAVWLQRGDVVVDIAEDVASLNARAASATTGQPLAGVRLEVADREGGGRPFTAVTDAGGLAIIDATAAQRGDDWVVLAKHGGTTTIVPRTSPHEPGPDPDEWRPDARGHFINDRPIYEPGDTLRFAGWLRRAAGVGREPVAVEAGTRVPIAARGPRGETLRDDMLRVGTNGRIEAEIPLPPGVNAGFGQVIVDVPGTRTGRIWHRFEIQEVRRPNFEVVLRVDPGSYVPGDRIEAAVDARYFTGGAMPGASVGWMLRSTPARYTPPGAGDYWFGFLRHIGGRNIGNVSHTGRTDAAGTHSIIIPIDSVRPEIPMMLSLAATATDLDQQRRTASGTIIVHPAQVYVGLRAQATFVRAGEPLIVETSVVDLDGRPVAGRAVTLRALRQERVDEDGVVRVRDGERGVCELESRIQPMRCRLDRLPAGDYIVLATVTDSMGRRSRSELPVRIAGETIPAGAHAARDSIALSLDRASYEPGDTALVLIEPSFASKEAWLTIRRGGVLESRVVRFDRGSALLRLPITDRFAPNVEIAVSALAADGAATQATERITVAPTRRTLDVDVAPAAAILEPGARTTVRVAVADAEGRPVPGAQVVLLGVDESLIALSRNPFNDPIGDLYPRSGPGVADRSLRRHLAPGIENIAATADASVRASGAGGAARPGPGTLTGVVLDAMNGRPLARAWIEIAGVGGAWTRPDGTYRLRGVPAGSHVPIARVDGYVAMPAAVVSVPAAGVARSNFVMLTRYAVLMGGRSIFDYWDARAAELRLEAVALSESVVSGGGGRGGALAGGIMLRTVPFTIAETTFDLAAAPAMTPPPNSNPAGLLRTNFTPVAAFETEARTGAGGTVDLEVEVPDNLTRYRLRAVAMHGDGLIGVGESTLTVKRVLMARPVAPRFLNHGDHFELPVLIENRGDAPLEADVAVRATNASLTGATALRVSVPAGDRVEVRFPARARDPGTAVFQVAATRSGSGATTRLADAAEVVVPVITPAVTESFVVYGELDGSRPAAYPLELPTGAVPGQTRVEVGLAATAVHGLRDGLLFLINCFWRLPEVYASRIIALTSLRDAPAARPWPVDVIDAAVESDVLELARAQLQDGGWSVWAARFESDPFVSVHAAHALQRAHQIGLAVPERTLADAREFLRRLDEFAPEDSDRPRMYRSPFTGDFPMQARYTVQAYALDTRRRLGDAVAASASRLLHDAGPARLTAEALAWLLPALAASADHTADATTVRREIEGRLVRAAGTASVVSPYEAGGHAVFHSPRRTDAVVLAALAEAGYLPELRSSIARGLMAHRVRGRWSNSQENAFAVAALSRFLGVDEAAEPDFVARVWAGPRLATESSFDGRADERRELSIPADSLGAPGSRFDMTLAREGAGRMYYRVGLRYALLEPTPAAANGFEVSRVYEAIDDPDDVRRDEDGVWHVRRGARVRVRITVANAGPRYHVAITDPLPAGFEAVNPALAGNAGAAGPPAQSLGAAAAGVAGATIERLYPQHVNVRDDRHEAFTTLLHAGRREYSYIALATVPGDFTAPAPRAEEMYALDTFGRAASDRVIVEVERERR